MNKELIGVILTYGLTMLLAIPLGRSIARWLDGQRTAWNLAAPLERFFYRFAGIDPKAEMNWKQHVKALLVINLVWVVYAFFMLIFQGSLFGNPDGNASQSTDLAFNTAISFLVNCDLQHYSGESGLTYLTQVFVIAFLQFTSAATGIAAVFVLFRALRNKVTDKLGNFWVFFVQSITRILLPISFVIALILAFNGTPTSFDAKDSIVTLQGDSVQVSRGPAAAMIAIKHLGTNGGGWFGTNSAHPLENPNFLTNSVELIAQMLIPLALLFAFGYYLKRRKFAWVIYAVMTLGFVCLVVPTMISEIGGNPAIQHMGIAQATGSMEGKETRFGPANSAFWSIATTVISTGSVNSMHDSGMPISVAMQLLAMMTNAFYGGCGVGLLNYFIYLVIAVFISGLMVGRTPELLGRKVEAGEMKIASMIAILHPLLILAFTAVAGYLFLHFADAAWVVKPSAWAVKPSAWLNNPGPRGFSEMLYENTSAAANNGSGLEGLGDNNKFWNYSTGIILLLGRFLPVIGPLAIAGMLARKKYIPENAGTLRSDSFTFGLMTFGVIVLIAALSFFPALTLGPLAEYFSLHK